VARLRAREVSVVMRIDWTPPWRMLDEAPFALVAISLAQGFEISITSTRNEGDVDASASWICQWLHAWLLKLSGDSRTDCDYTFIYLLFDPSQGKPSGLVDGKGVLEIGYGSDPAGPPSGKLATLEGLVHAICG
jgi:hypothetical protein